MNPKFNSRKLYEFFENFEQKNPTYLLGLIIVSLGLYIITWIYSLNKDFELIDENAPDSTRGVIVLVALPFTWFFIMSFIKFLSDSITIQIVEMVVYLLLYFLAMKYIFEFCLTFIHITQTSLGFWYGGILLGSFGFFALFFESYYMLLLLVLLVLIVPFMQAELNVTCNKVAIKRNYHSFYKFDNSFQK